MPELAEVERLVRLVAGFGLPGWEPAGKQAVPVDLWATFLYRVGEQRISGLAVECAAAGWLELTDEQVDGLLGLHREAMGWALTVERLLIRLSDAFDADGLGFLVLKGPSVAHTVYADPSLRSFGDMDLLVRTQDWRAATALLERLEIHRDRPEPRAGFDERFGKAAMHRSEERIEVDLHRTLVLGPFGLWIDPDELFDHTRTFDMGGRTIRRLDDTGILLNVAMHAALGWRPPRLAPLRDVLQVAWEGKVDWDVIADWAVRWRMGVVFGFAFTEAAGVLGADVPPEAGMFLEREPSRSELRVLEAYTTERRQRGGMALTTLRAIPGLRGKAAYLRSLALPDRRFLEARARESGRAQRSYFQRMKIPLRWITGKRHAA